MRFALKIYYDGREFYGSQRQPDKRTVEGELRDALLRLRVGLKRICFAGRTDRGASALGNVCCVDIDKKHAKLMQAKILNALLPKDVRVLGIKKVKSDFNPRLAVERVYKYFLKNENYDIAKMREAAKLFTGKHDFSNFSVIELNEKDTKNPIRNINKIEIEEKNNCLVLTFSAQSFLRQMVRRIVTALILAGREEISVEELEKYFEKNLSSEAKKLFLPADAENLVLWDVRYKLKFDYEEHSFLKLIENLKDEKAHFEKEALAREEEINYFLASSGALHKNLSS